MKHSQPPKTNSPSTGGKRVGIIIAVIVLSAALIIGVLMTDTGTNKVSLRGYRILKELPDTPRPKAKTEEEIKSKAQRLADDE